MGVRSRVENKGREVVGIYRLGSAIARGHLPTVSQNIQNKT